MENLTQQVIKVKDLLYNSLTNQDRLDLLRFVNPTRDEYKDSLIINIRVLPAIGNGSIEIKNYQKAQV